MAKSPVKEIKFGSVKISVWERQTEKYGTQTSFSLTKPYKDKDDKWQNPTVYLNNATDVLNVIQCCQELLNWKYRKEDNDNSSDEQEI